MHGNSRPVSPRRAAHLARYAVAEPAVDHFRTFPQGHRMSTPTDFRLSPRALLALTLVATLLAPRETLAQRGAANDEGDAAASVALGPPGDAPETTLRIPEIVPVLGAPTMSDQAGPAQSEAVSEFCWRPRPSSSCRVFAVTDFGVLFGLTQRGWSSVFANRTDVPAWRGEIVSDLGVMWNVGSRQALGATWLIGLTFDDSEWLTGPAVRYRRWLKGKQSLDLAVGTAIAPLGDDYGDLRRGSVLGLLKYNPAPWVGFAIRAESLRRTDCAMPVGGKWSDTLRYCGHFEYDPPGWIEPGKEVRPVSTSRILAGIELSDKPGLAVNIVWWGLAGLLFVGFATASN